MALPDSPVDEDRVHICGVSANHDSCSSMRDRSKIHVIAMNEDDVSCLPWHQTPGSPLKTAGARALDGGKVQQIPGTEFRRPSRVVGLVKHFHLLNLKCRA